MNRTLRQTFIVLVVVLLGWIGFEIRETSAPDLPIGDRLIATQSPRPYPFSVPFPDLDECYPPGSRIVILRLGKADAQEDIISGALYAAGAPAISPDYQRVVFAGKESATSKWNLYETSLRGGTPRLWVSMEGDCGDPAYVSNDSIVFACRSESQNWRLFTAARRQSKPQQITFGKDSARYPTVLRDGRILFSMEQTRFSEESCSIGLFTVNPDGTLLDGFLESHVRGEAYLRPSQSPDETHAAFVCVSPGTQVPRVAVASIDCPGKPSFPASAALGVSSVNVNADGAIVTTGRMSAGKNAFGIYRLDESVPTLLFDNPEWNEIEVVPVASRRPARGRPVQTDPSKAYGELVCYDVHRTDGILASATEPSAAASFQLETEEGSRFGPFDINQDGAFYLKVPADVAIRVSTFDKLGTLRAKCNWIWVRPGEKRACFGCHEGSSAAPVNRPLTTLLEPPMDLVEGLQMK